MEILLKIITNKILVSCFLAWLIANIIQIINYYVRNKSLDFREIYKLGGFPSRHSAGISALVLSVFLIEEISTLSIVTFVLSIVVVRDALERHSLKDVLVGLAIGIIVTAFVFYM